MSSRASEHLRQVQQQFARRAKVFGYSPWAEPGAAIEGRPGAIYFGNGAPAPEAHPLERLQWASQQVWLDARGALGYGEVEGYLPLRQLICQRMRLRGIDVVPAEVLITCGSQQGIDLIARLLLDPGDTIIVEGPTYIGAMQALDVYEPQYLVAPLDEHGPDVRQLMATVDQMERPPKLAYLIPTFQNPTGYSYGLVQRQDFLQMAHERGVVVVEDDPYGEIYFGQKPPPAMRADDPSVIYLGTFSKTIAPGIRVGWLVAPPPLMELLIMAKEGADINSDRIMMRTVHVAAEGFLDQHVASVRGLYRKRRDALLAGLALSMPTEVTWTAPEGGFFLWLRLPPGASANDLLQVAARHDVAFLPGSLFYPSGQEDCATLRLGYSALPEATLQEGARRLGIAARDYLERLA